MKIKAKDKIYIENLLNEYPRRIDVLKKYDLDMEELKLNLGEDSIKGIDYSKDKIQTSNTVSSIENQVLKMEKEIEELKEIQSRKKIHFDKIEIALRSLTDMQRKLIEYRYFKRYTWGTCEKYIGYTDRHCMNISNDIITLLFNYYKIKKP